MTRPLQSQGLWTGCLVGSGGGCMARFSSLNWQDHSGFSLEAVASLVLCPCCVHEPRENPFFSPARKHHPPSWLVEEPRARMCRAGWSSGKHAEDRTRRWEPSILPKSGVWEPGQPLMAIQVHLTPKEQSFKDLNTTCCHSIHVLPVPTPTSFCSSSEIMFEKGPGKLYMLSKH